MFSSREGPFAEIPPNRQAHHDQGSTTPYFSPDFRTAQRRFRAAVAAHKGRLDVLKLAAKGPQEEELAIDIGWVGAANPQRIFIHSSGIHGIEGFAGSAIQLRCLEERLPALPADSTVVMVHVLNPYGMAWLRRVKENGVDLNRNFRGANDSHAPGNDDYLKLDSFLNPQSPPRLDLFYLRAIWLTFQHGMPVLRQAVAGGQFIEPKGLFYGGKEMEEGPRLFQDYVKKHFANAKRIVAIDVHTGLGSYGDYRLLVDATKERARTNQKMLKPENLIFLDGAAGRGSELLKRETGLWFRRRLEEVERVPGAVAAKRVGRPVNIVCPRFQPAQPICLDRSKPPFYGAALAGGSANFVSSTVTFCSIVST